MLSNHPEKVTPDIIKEYLLGALALSFVTQSAGRCFHHAMSVKAKKSFLQCIPSSTLKPLEVSQVLIRGFLYLSDIK